MEAVKDFDSFYEMKIAPILGDLKTENRSKRKWGYMMAVSILLAAGAFTASYYGYTGAAGPGPGIIFILLFFFSIYSYTKSGDGYIDHFKEAVIHEIINYIHPGITYKPMDFMPSKEYKHSGLYRRRYDDIDGDDYMEGLYKDVRFRCSELTTSYESGIPPNSIKTGIFKGLFFSAVVNSNYTGGTYVWRKGHGQLGGSIADERYRLFPLPEVSRLSFGNAEFDEQFSVYSSYPSQAREILTAEMMHNLVKFKKQVARNISFSVVAGKCYVSIPIEEDLLEPSRNIADKETVKEYFFTVLLVLSIINQLELYRLA